MKTFVVDSFTDIPFKGNPAGVCLAEEPLTEPLMQSIAKELGFSETAFVSENPGQSDYSIRYFSPMMEIPLCGHATLASSKVLFHIDATKETIVFTTIRNVKLEISKADDRIAMKFPVYSVQPKKVPDELLKAMGISRITNCVFNCETEIVLLEIESDVELGRLTPDFAAMVQAYQGIHGVLVTALSSDGEHDFHSRFFWPWSGGEEDPVTGGTHTFLAKYWGERLEKNAMRSFQSSARTGSMDVELLDEKSLMITAHATILFAGDWVAHDGSAMQ